MPELTGQETISRELERACADEPIRIIGTVQPHGFMVIVDITTLRIVQVSSGAARHWPGLDTAERVLHGHLGYWIDGTGALPQLLLEALPVADPIALPWQPRRFIAPGTVGTRDPHTSVFECVGHRVGHLAVLEWQPTTASASETGEGMVVITQSLLRLRSAQALDLFYRDCVREVARLCSFDRVMLYQFLPDWSGEVIAEQAAGILTTRFLGLRFPASDIPAQARALYTESKIRVLADLQAPPDTLLPPLTPSGEPLDQSHSLLRGFSQVHQTYLKNMGVRATMSLSIVCEGKLWGLIACHHYQPRVPPYQVRHTLRRICELVAGVTAMRIETLSRLTVAQDTVAMDQLLVNLHQAVLQDEDTGAVLARLLPELLAAFRASALIVGIGELQYVSGGTLAPVTAGEVTREVAARIADASPDEVLECSDLLTPAGVPLTTLPRSAGLLAVRRRGEPAEFCGFTRAEIVREVNWAGEPVKRAATMPDGHVRLEPRRSFDVWRETIGGNARSWSPAEVKACGRLLRILSDACQRRDHKALELELRFRAHHDHLTGLVNRRSMEESLDLRLGAARFDSAVMLIDLDHFKMINDTHGHAAGDRLLQALSTRLSSVIRPSDILSRVGGDEFLLLAEMVPLDHAAALAIANRLHAIMEKPFDVEGQSVRLALSVGIAIPPDHGTNATDLMRRADLALYRAKKSGRASTVIFDAPLEEGLIGAYELERDLQEAIVKNELSLVFQPEVDLSTGRVVALEALLRWTHPERGAVEPNVFIPIAERSDLIIQIGHWVMRSVIATQAEWRSRGDLILPVAVNVSMNEVTSGNLVDTIARLLHQYQMPPQCLTVELTESVIMKDPRVAMRVLSALRQLGIFTALDDFGTGYSSLSRLRQLPLNALKVDQSFTADLTEDAHSRSLTQAIIRMAEALKMTTIAEGVETRGQLDWLRAQKCTLGQGFLFSPAVAAELVPLTRARIEADWKSLH